WTYSSKSCESGRVWARSYASRKRSGSVRLAARFGRCYPCENAKVERPKEIVMRMLSAAAVIVLLTAPAYAQMPNVNMMPELRSKSPEEKEQDAIRDKAYKDSLKKIPDAKGSSDPWGTMPSTDTPKAAPAKQKTKTGSSSQ